MQTLACNMQVLFTQNNSPGIHTTQRTFFKVFENFRKFDGYTKQLTKDNPYSGRKTTYIHMTDNILTIE